MSKKNFESLKRSVTEAGEILRREQKPLREFKVKISGLATNKKNGFALCIKSDEPELLIPSKVYRARFSSNDNVGITDESGEAAVYPADYFMKLIFPSEIEGVLGKLQKAA